MWNGQGKAWSRRLCWSPLQQNQRRDFDWCNMLHFDRSAHLEFRGADIVSDELIPRILRTLTELGDGANIRPTADESSIRVPTIRYEKSLVDNYAGGLHRLGKVQGGGGMVVCVGRAGPTLQQYLPLRERPKYCPSG